MSIDLETEIPELISEHDAIGRQLGQLRRVSSADVADIAAITAFRWRLAQAMAAHQAKAMPVIRCLLEHGDAPAVRSVRGFLDGHVGVQEYNQAFFASWPLDRLRADWSAFRLEAEIFVTQVERVMREEEEAVYDHAVRLSCLRRGRSAA